MMTKTAIMIQNTFQLKHISQLILLKRYYMKGSGCKSYFNKWISLPVISKKCPFGSSGQLRQGIVGAHWPEKCCSSSQYHQLMGVWYNMMLSRDASQYHIHIIHLLSHPLDTDLSSQHSHSKTLQINKIENTYLQNFQHKQLLLTNV